MRTFIITGTLVIIIISIIIVVIINKKKENFKSLENMREVQKIPTEMLELAETSNLQSFGSHITYCTKTANFKLFGMDTDIRIKISEFLKTWSATATASLKRVKEDSIIPSFGSSTTTTTVTIWGEGDWTGTSTTSASMEGTTTTTTSTVTVSSIFPSTATTTTTSASGGVVSTTTTTSSLKLTKTGGSSSSTSTTTSSGVTTTTSTSTTFDNLLATDNIWVAFFTSSSSSASGSVVTTHTTTSHIMAIKNGDFWKGSISINSATASGGSSHTDSYCYQFTLPGSMSPGKNFSHLWAFIASTWNNFLKHSSNHLGILGVITHILGCE